MPLSAAFRCLVCHGGEGTAVYLGCGDGYLGTPFRVDYFRCRACGLLQQFPVPADVSAFYERYPIHARKPRVYGALRRLVMSSVYYDLARHPKGSVLLDYGCGDGGYLERYQGKGFTLLGYEGSRAQATRLAGRLGLPVYADMETLRGEREGAVDVVTMHFALEHLTDLDAAFRDVHALLRPGGVFYYVVPHASSFEARLFARRWHNLDPPRHISFPDSGAARRLADRHGFTVSDEHPVAFPNGVAGSLPVVLTGRFRFPLFAAFLPLGVAFSRLVPTGCRAYHLVRV
ncbi:MAG TPA: class I SAM-dependent methyltransferase [Vicinamibacteria bacterium]|nr:class I SAM-dependent methyltransferase [Vicinamibacteria bacterium]